MKHNVKVDMYDGVFSGFHIDNLNVGMGKLLVFIPQNSKGELVDLNADLGHSGNDLTEAVLNMKQAKYQALSCDLPDIILVPPTYYNQDPPYTPRIYKCKHFVKEGERVVQACRHVWIHNDFDGMDPITCPVCGCADVHIYVKPAPKTADDKVLDQVMATIGAVQ
jgi:hypothetical protein